MKEEEIQHIASHLEGVIKTTVNGKIDALSKDFREHKEEMQPILDAYKTAGNIGNFVVWVAKVIMAIGVIGAFIFGATKLK